MNNATKNAENVQKIKSLVLCYEIFIRIHMEMEMQWEIEKYLPTIGSKYIEE